jgi:hypothetical protein
MPDETSVGYLQLPWLRLESMLKLTAQPCFQRVLVQPPALLVQEILMLCLLEFVSERSRITCGT